MSIPDYVLNQIKCCSNCEDKNHVLIEPVLLKSGGNACKECINDSFKCLHCNSIHSNHDLTECKSAESLIRYFMKDLSDHLDVEIHSTKDLLKCFK